MRYLILALLMGFAIAAAQDALADEEFGKRFADETPAGMAEGTYEPEESPAIAMDEQAIRLQDIIPAAGEEEEGIKENSSNSENNLAEEQKTQ